MARQDEGTKNLFTPDPIVPEKMDIPFKPILRWSFIWMVFIPLLNFAALAKWTLHNIHPERSLQNAVKELQERYGLGSHPAPPSP